MRTVENPGQALFVEQKRLAEHYKDVESFYSQREKTRKNLSRAMIVITSVALLGNLGQAWTIASLVPLARIVPVFLWLRPDGTVDDSVSMSTLPPTQSKALINASLWEYVRLREGYSFDTAQYNYDVVSGYSSPKVRDQYQNFFNYPNPDSPQVTVGKKGAITISHISSSDIAPNLQQIRFSRTITFDGRSPITTTMTATVGFALADKVPANDRLTNPGGLLITSYQSAEDSVK